MKVEEVIQYIDEPVVIEWHGGAIKVALRHHPNIWTIRASLIDALTDLAHIREEIYVANIEKYGKHGSELLKKWEKQNNNNNNNNNNNK